MGNAVLLAGDGKRQPDCKQLVVQELLANFQVAETEVGRAIQLAAVDKLMAELRSQLEVREQFEVMVPCVGTPPRPERPDAGTRHHAC